MAKLVQLTNKNGEDITPIIGGDQLATVVPVNLGGTGANSASNARTNLGLANAVTYEDTQQTTEVAPIPIAGGGTGAITAAAARENLGFGDLDYNKIKAISDTVNSLTNTDFTIGNFKVNEGRIQVDSGGYMQVGNRCFVQMACTIIKELAGNDYWTLGDGLPTPRGTGAALSAHYHSVNAPVNVGVYGGNLSITCGNQQLLPGKRLFITGSYIVE